MPGPAGKGEPEAIGIDPVAGGLRGTGAAVAGARCGEPEAMAGSPAESSACVPQPIARPAASAPAPIQALCGLNRLR